MGTHLYWRETIEAGCKTSDDSQGTDYVEKIHVFSPDFSSVTYGDRPINKPAHIAMNPRISQTGLWC
jgi:hypothetical protein